MTDINITIEDIPVSGEGKVVKQITFKGQLDETNVDEKAKLIYALIEQNPKGLNLLMDFENLEYMNSKSIGYLTDWYSKVSEGGGKIVIAKARPNILDILEVVGLTQLISCFPTSDEAKLAMLDKAASGPEIPKA
jgi:anti-anti-sigma factor